MGLKLKFSHHLDYASNVGRIQSPVWLFAAKEQVKQNVVYFLEKHAECMDVFIRQIQLVLVEKLLNNQVVFQQTTAGAPPQAGAFGWVGLMILIIHKTTTKKTGFCTAQPRFEQKNPNEGSRLRVVPSVL